MAWATPSFLKLNNKYGHDPFHYPIKAVSFTISHPSLLNILIRITCTGCALSLVILVVLLATALKPQAKWISSNLRWWSWPVAVCLVFLESTICVGLLLVVSKTNAQKNLFVPTIRQEGIWRGNEMVSRSTIKDLKLLGKGDIVKLITIPLQTIPFLGGVVYSAINATFTGWEYMGQYFKAIKLSSCRSDDHRRDTTLTTPIAERDRMMHHWPMVGGRRSGGWVMIGNTVFFAKSFLIGTLRKVVKYTVVHTVVFVSNTGEV
jgi:hypothetical protein